MARMLVLILGALWFWWQPLEHATWPHPAALSMTLAEATPRLVIIGLMYGAAYLADKKKDEKP